LMTQPSRAGTRRNIRPAPNGFSAW
jgi:hypothetical protein